MAERVVRAGISSRRIKRRISEEIPGSTASSHVVLSDELEDELDDDGLHPYEQRMHDDPEGQDSDPITMLRGKTRACSGS